MMPEGILIRPCRGFDELRACVQMQIKPWGYDATDVIPLKGFLLAQKIGGQVLGAFDLNMPDAGSEGTPATLIGFVLSLPGVKTAVDAAPWPYLHSHMLAVTSGCRNRGIGRALKLAQRSEALARGIRHMEWTFDPLEIKNARLNIAKLGARCRRYAADFYGHSTSKLQAGLPTDRLFAEWSMDSPQVQLLLEGRAQPLDAAKIAAQITVPAEICEWKRNAPEKALEVHQRNRVLFEQAFSRGLVVAGFALDSGGNGIYQLVND
jgi:predicted GNAT superfamily acetyltransferase